MRAPNYDSASQPSEMHTANFSYVYILQSDLGSEHLVGHLPGRGDSSLAHFAGESSRCRWPVSLVERAMDSPAGAGFIEKKSNVFTRLTAALSIDGKAVLRAPASPEEFADIIRAGAKEAEGVARLVGNGQASVVLGRNGGSAWLKGCAPAAEKQANQ